MSHTENCMVCFSAVLDVDDGEHLLMAYKVIDDKFICKNCYYKLEEAKWMAKDYALMQECDTF